ncbi:MAG: DUF6364 family protein [Leptospiraceae bacterium]|nr:DUF6364 family protein [Leptospiraceae bacterium]
MLTKLTLSVDKDVIESAKEYAKKRKTSVSRLVEDFLKSISEKNENKKGIISPITKQLSGVLKKEKQTNTKEKKQK